MSKQAIRRAFDRAAASYDDAAKLQREVCRLLLETLTEPAPQRILDAGCGTGYALSLLGQRWPAANVVAADFAPGMIAAAGGGICADIEALPIAEASFDLYWSSLSFQWCDSVRATREAARVLKPGGCLAVSTLAPGTLAELDTAFADTDGHRHVLEFPPADAMAQACAAAALTDIAVRRHSLCFHHQNLGGLLRELKALGANEVGTSRRPGLMGRRAWQAIERRYEALRTAAGLPATFEVVLCTARKPIS